MNWWAFFSFLAAISVMLIYVFCVVVFPLTSVGLFEKYPICGFVYIFLTLVLPMAIYIGLTAGDI